MSKRFKKSRLMGNCRNCYYATLDANVGKTDERRFNCHRFPSMVWVTENDYCGEFVQQQESDDLVRGDA